MTALSGGRYHIRTGPAPLPFPAPAAFRFGENDEYVKYGHAPFASGGAGDPYWTPEIITQTWFMAAGGKIPISGAGYGGPFAGAGFDGIWLDMSEIVRPTRDGIHGREYISTAVDLGAKSERLALTADGRSLELDGPPPLMPLPPAVVKPLLNLIHRDAIGSCIRGMRRELEPPSPGALTRYEFEEQWSVEAPIQEVWPVIRDVAGYPRWWPEFVEVTKRNQIDGVGGIVGVHAKAALPYHMSFDLESIREEAPRIAEVRVRGDLNGTMKWTLLAEGSGTRLLFRETVRTGKQLLNLLAPLFKPAFAWNHEIMMRSGERGLRRLLAQRRAERTAAPVRS